MLRTTLLLLAVVLAVSTFFFSTAFAADLPSSLPPTTEQLTTRVVVVADKNKWAINIDQVQRTLEAGVNMGTNLVVIPIGCDATDCQDAIAVNLQSCKIIRLPTAAYGYDFRPGNNLLIVNPHPKDFFKGSGSTELPDWLFREFYVLQDGKLVQFRKDKATAKDIPNEKIFEMFLSARFVQQ